MIRLFVSDIDGTLTNGKIYISEKGDKLKKFLMRDGLGLNLLKKNTKVITMLITSEKGGINKIRANKFFKLKTLDYFFDNCYGKDKLEKVKTICNKLDITLKEVAYIGDDVNDMELLESVGIKACPNDAHWKIQMISKMNVMKENGGNGAVREFIDYLIDRNLCCK